MYVIKESGEKEKLDLKKLKLSLYSAGASKNLVNKTIREVKRKAYPGVTTREILHTVLQCLKEEAGVSQRYNLKRAVMLLGPSGFPFEKFVARILREYQYKTKTNVLVRGKCVMQEIDVQAVKNKQKFMIECKYHNTPGKKSDLKVVMYTYARFLDVQHKGFDQGWLVTNTKCTTEAEKYAACSGLRVISWKYPKEFCLEKMLEQRKLYPITTLFSVNFQYKEKLIKSNVILLRDLLDQRLTFLRMKTRLPKKVLKILREEAREVLAET